MGGTQIWNGCANVKTTINQCCIYNIKTFRVSKISVSPTNFFVFKFLCLQIWNGHGNVVPELHQSCSTQSMGCYPGEGSGECMVEKQCCTNVRPALGTFAILESVQTTMPALTTIIQPLSMSPNHISPYSNVQPCGHENFSCPYFLV